MPFDFNPITGNLDLVDSPAGYINGVVETPADLPVTLGTPPLDAVYLAKAGSGIWLINRQPAGLYCRVANNGNAADWKYLGAFPEVNADGNWELYNTADPTKELKFDLSGLTTGTTRTLTVPDASGTLPLLETANTFSANQTLDGTNNVAPNQTAASGSSLMTRDLVDARFVTPRNRFDVTHFFGVQGAGAFQTAGTSAVATFAVSSIGNNAAWGLWTNARIGSNSAGAAFRLGNNGLTGNAAFATSTAGAYTVRGRVGKGFNNNLGAAAFILGSTTSSAMWHANSLGLYFVPQPTSTWAATTAYSQHDRIDVGGIVWAVSTAGTTGATEPTWTNTIDGTVADGTVVWRNCGPHTSNEWAFGFGGTDSSAISLTSTGKAGWGTNQRNDFVLTLRYGGQTAAPYLFYASVENAAGESAELSISTNTNLLVSPQFWVRNDTATNADHAIILRYYSQQSTLNALV